VIIAHRLATVRRADAILVLDHGRIVQQGSERELLATDGPFRRLAETLHAPARRVA
jgi:ATP-binding cassette subfamily B protein